MSQGRLPYVRGNFRDKWRLERQAQATRARLNLTQYDVIDPWRLADLVPAHVFYVDDIVDAELALAQVVQAGMALPFSFRTNPP